MILKDLVMKYEFEDVKKRLNVLYPNPNRNIRGYENVYEVLRKKRAGKSDMEITIVYVREKGETPYYHVNGKDETENRWALDFSSFSRWAGYIVDKKNYPRRMTEIDVLAHCLWEMTYHGFTDNVIRGVVGKLRKRIKDISVRELKG